MTNTDLPCLKRGRKRRPLPSKLRFKILHRDGFKCRYCGATSDDDQLHIDHVYPVSAGGDDSEDNLVTSCASCNMGKSGQILDEPDDHNEMARHVIYRLLYPQAGLDPAMAYALIASFACGESFENVRTIREIAETTEEAIEMLHLLHLEGIEE